MITVDRLGMEHDVEQEINCGHVVLRVTTESGNSYALDITGAQYGRYENVMPWHLYLNSRIESFTGFGLFGEWESRLLADDFWDRGSAHEALRELNKHRTLRLNSALVNWEKENMPLSAILKLSEDAFQRKQLELISFVQGCLPTDQRMKKIYRSMPKGWKETKTKKGTDGNV